MNSKKSNLLLHLYTWASRQDENYTTEAFVHLLNYLVENEPVVARVILEKLTNGFLHYNETNLQAISQITITTQPRTAYGTPDIEIKAPDQLIYIEVKVESGLGEQQLGCYRQALQNSGVESTQLILLTRYAITSEGEQPDFAIRWYEIADWLDEALKKLETKSISMYLIQQFKEYLQEKNMTITQVKSGISSGIREHQKVYGAGSIFSKRNRRLSKYIEYPELTPLHNLLMMVGEAITNLKIDVKPRFDSSITQGGWVGYNLHGLQYFVCVYLPRPEVLTFETYNVHIDSSKHNKTYGRIQMLDGINQWVNEFDLSLPELNFFSQSRDIQIRMIEKFILESYEYSQLLLN